VECQNRPAGMSVVEWYACNGITKTNYYYQLRRVREACLENTRYVPTGNIIFRQVTGICVVPMVTEYYAVEFLDKKKGRNAHSTFPDGVTDDVNYDESIKAVLFLLNSRCNVSLEKTAQFVSNNTGGALSPCVGMINDCAGNSH